MTRTQRGKREAQRKLESLFDELLNHNGYADMRLEIRLLKRGQKEVIIHCGKQYRYVVDVHVPDPSSGESA